MIEGAGKISGKKRNWVFSVSILKVREQFGRSSSHDEGFKVDFVIDTSAVEKLVRRWCNSLIVLFVVADWSC